MNAQIPVRRMSPFTALFLGFAAVLMTGIAALTAVGLYGMSIVDDKASAIVNLVEGTVENVPELLHQIAPAVTEIFGDRDPSYAANISVKASFIPDQRHGTLRPALTIVNNGTETVSMLGVRVAALNAQGVPVADWSDVVATPLPIDDLPGPLFPGETRHIILRSWNDLKVQDASSVNPAVEVTEVRLWRPDAAVRPGSDVAVASAVEEVSE